MQGPGGVGGGVQQPAQDYLDFARSVDILSFDALKRMGRLSTFARYIVSVMRLFEERYFDRSGNRLQTPDTSVMHGYDNDGLFRLLRNNLGPSLTRLTYEVTPAGLKIIPTAGDPQNLFPGVKQVGGSNYIFLRIPQSLALLHGLDQINTLDQVQLTQLRIAASPAITRQIAVGINANKIELPVATPNVADSLDALAAEIGERQFTELTGRPTQQPTQRLLYEIRP
jgi:hypothetical protein